MPTLANFKLVQLQLRLVLKNLSTLNFVQHANDTESDSDGDDEKPVRIAGTKAKSPSTLSQLPKAKRAKRAKEASKVPATWALDEDPEEPQGPQAPQEQEATTKMRFGRKIRFSPGMPLEEMPKNSDLVFVRDAASSGSDLPMCFVGFKVYLKDIEPTHATRVPKQKLTASPASSAQESAQPSAQSSAAPSPAKPAKPTKPATPAKPAATPAAPVAQAAPAAPVDPVAPVAAPAATQPVAKQAKKAPQVPQAQQAQATKDDAVVVRVVVVTEMEMRACDKHSDKRKAALGKIDRLVALLAPLSSSPLAVVAPSRVLSTIGANCISLINGGLHHIAVPVDTYPIEIDAAAALITARVRATQCLNPTGNPDLSVRLAFAYTGDADYGFTEGRLIMPKAAAKGDAGLGYPMMSYARPAVEPRLAELAASRAYTNYTAPATATHVAQPPAAVHCHAQAILEIKIKQERDESNAIWL